MKTRAENLRDFIEIKKTYRTYNFLLFLVYYIRVDIQILFHNFVYLQYIYIYIRLKIKPNSVRIRFLELSNFCSSLDGIWTHTIDTLQYHSLSLTSSTLDHSTTSTPCIYIYIYIYTTSEKPVNDQSYGVLDRYGITILYK